MDKRPGDLDKPEGFPTMIWCYWDSWGEYMDTTDDPVYGERWIASATERNGYAAVYRLDKIAGFFCRPRQGGTR